MNTVKEMISHYILHKKKSKPKKTKVQLAAKLLLKPSSASKLEIKVREKIINNMTLPKQVGIQGSMLKFYAHSVTEDARIRKFKEPWTIEWMRSLPNNAVLYDVGANIGITALIAAEDVRRNVNVVAIEPAPANFASLVKNIVLNELDDRLYALQIGLGDATGVARFNLTTCVPGGSMHSFGKITYLNVGKSTDKVANHYCLRTRFDDLVNWEGLPFPTHIKIDIDGGEVELLLGAKHVLCDTRCRALQIEVVDPDARYERSQQVVKLMSTAGFSVVARYNHNNTFPLVADIQFARL